MIKELILYIPFLIVILVYAVFYVRYKFFIDEKETEKFVRLTYPYVKKFITNRRNFFSFIIIGSLLFAIMIFVSFLNHENLIFNYLILTAFIFFTMGVGMMGFMDISAKFGLWKSNKPYFWRSIFDPSPSTSFDFRQTEETIFSSDSGATMFKLNKSKKNYKLLIIIDLIVILFFSVISLLIYTIFLKSTVNIDFGLLIIIVVTLNIIIYLIECMIAFRGTIGGLIADSDQQFLKYVANIEKYEDNVGKSDLTMK